MNFVIYKFVIYNILYNACNTKLLILEIYFSEAWDQ